MDTYIRMLNLLSTVDIQLTHNQARRRNIDQPDSLFKQHYSDTQNSQAIKLNLP